jgi:uncharacterized protein (TIGR00251 family)
MNRLNIKETETGVTIEIKLHPRAGRDRLAGVINNRLKIDVAAAPIKNKANRSMIKLLSKTLKVPQKAIVIKRGTTSRNKLIEIRSISTEKVTKLIFTK